MLADKFDRAKSKQTNLSPHELINAATTADQVRLPAESSFVFCMATKAMARPYPVDCHLVAFGLGSNDKVERQSNFIFFNHRRSPGLLHRGRRPRHTESGEEIEVALPEIPYHVRKVVFAVGRVGLANSLHDLCAVSSALYARRRFQLLNYISNHDLGSSYVFQLATLTRCFDDWTLEAEGKPLEGSFHSVCWNFGIVLDR